MGLSSRGNNTSSKTGSLILCEICSSQKASLKRPKTSQRICRECFYEVFETEVHNTIVNGHIFQPGERVAVGASGGKDSTVLAHVLKVLNERYKYGIELVLLSVDEGITGYRDDSLETVKRNKEQYGLPLQIISYKDLYGWSMDEIVANIGKKNNCTYCGVFRRQALDRGASMLGISHIVTGHNADDLAETILMNLLRGDAPRLSRCTSVITESDGSQVKRSKPFKYAYEKEIVLYAKWKNLDYFSTECIYSPEAFRGTARALVKDLEAVRPSSIMDIIHSGEAFELNTVGVQDPEHKRQLSGRKIVKLPDLEECARCGYITSSTEKICKACALLESLEKTMPRITLDDGQPIRITKKPQITVDF